MPHHRRTLALLAAFALGALAACGGSSKAAEPTKTVVNGAITVDAFDVRFDVGVIKAAPGKLTVKFENKGAMQHDFKIDGTSMQLKADAGKTGTGSVDLAKGTYKFVCTIPGHEGQGMKGTVEVA